MQKTLEDRSEGVLLVDLAKPDWTILYNNEAWLNITGMGREEVLGANMFQIFTPAGQTKVCWHSVLCRFHNYCRHSDSPSFV